MSYEPPVLNPSQAVERIREIIIGRQMDHFDGRMLEVEAKLEAVQEGYSRMKQSMIPDSAAQREEVRLMAQKIHEVAKQKAEEVVLPAVECLERRLGQWLTDWQISLRQRLEERDRVLEERVRSELMNLREEIEQRFREIESKSGREMEMKFGMIAEAAKKLADCAAEVGLNKG